MTLNSDAKFEEKPICCFENDKNLVDFDPSTQVSNICTLIGPFGANSIKRLTQKSTEELSFMTLKSDAKFEENRTCGLENDMRNMANFHQSTQKFQNWDFYGVLLCKKENV